MKKIMSKNPTAKSERLDFMGNLSVQYAFFALYRLLESNKTLQYSIQNLGWSAAKCQPQRKRRIIDRKNQRYKQQISWRLGKKIDDRKHGEAP
jgi:hypothetical protein